MKRRCAALVCLCLLAIVVRLKADTTYGMVRLKADTAYVPQAPTARIVSTSPSITETLFALGLGSQVVGVSNYCRFPPEANALPKIGTFLRPDAELIARLAPTLVVVHAGPSNTAQQLSKLRIPFVTVERGTLSGVFSTINAIGKAAGASERATALISTLEARLGRIRVSVAGRPSQKVLIIMGRRVGTLTDLIAVGPGSYLHDLVGIAGGVNVLANSGFEYPRISLESVIRLDPDVIIDAGDMGDTPEDRERRRMTTEALWAAQTTVRAARTGRIHAVTSDIFVVPGPRVVEAADTMARWLHGVRAQ